ncbi:Trp biosynthesis-associated membrane protein [Brevibacterium jeotgali]|uniref:Tryptophan-associated transmembrane protein (Trp_oprn_chp) n=1 Tax=Brevibacterium jeotgali TaxID=1262550 RepID=A0A2H1L3F4_9MICO|nr:Trp biosynthesis-associated membrane protein [Brevibacterium jeotgali]TWC02931.1 tryptophan-associated transmembrane protein [Brevibacterium jeotgali]SMY10953.1 Tryptophan-associated transmembrane protein (Trp_oprn_chp) [Brevibacterium jeotgali]
MTKGRAVVVLLVLAGAVWILATLPWGVEAPGAGTGPSGVAEVAGEDGSGSHPLLSASAAVLAVAALLLAMLGRIGRIVVCVLIGAVGVGVVLTAVSSQAPATTLVPTIAAGAGVLVAAVWSAVASLGWRVSGRYDRQTDTAAPQADDDDPAAAWDALSRGEDPS